VGDVSRSSRREEGDETGGKAHGDSLAKRVDEAVASTPARQSTSEHMVSPLMSERPCHRQFIDATLSGDERALGELPHQF
jgi:hypothetical protein